MRSIPTHRCRVIQVFAAVILFFLCEVESLPMSCFSFSCNPIDCVKLFEDEARHCLFPRKREEQLKWDMSQLQKAKEAVREEVMVQQEKQPGTKCKRDVENWIESVDNGITDASDLLGKLENVKGCPGFWSWKSNYKHGMEVAEMLRRIKELEARREKLGDEFVSFPAEEPIEHFNLSMCTSQPVIGQEQTISEIKGCLQDDEVGIIGIYGMGGIGKTTILRKIQAEFLNDVTKCNFDLVMWVTVSRTVNVRKIQKQISEQMNLALPSDEGQWASTLYEKLSRRQFALLLDDVWGAAPTAHTWKMSSSVLDLTGAGIPILNNNQNRGSKIVFTTRSLDVCVAMKASRRIDVGLLNQGQSWELFAENVGAFVNLKDPAIRWHAEEVCKDCDGLPLALITVGQALGTYTTAEAWKGAKELLRRYPEEFPGIDSLLSKLRFSYDGLRDENLKSCLLCCSLYPEDFDIYIERISRLWFGEGLLDDQQGFPVASAASRTKAIDIVNKLKSACLLENSAYPDCVKMHDSVRDMCLWITNGTSFPGQSMHAVHNYADASDYVRRMQNWKAPKKISLICGDIQRLDECPPQCPNLETLLLLRCKGLEKICHGFFQFMPRLRVLDLSLTNIREVPKSLGLLKNLQYLNLSCTNIRSLPVEMGNLGKLRQLLLEVTQELSIIPSKTISRLSGLQALRLLHSGYGWGPAKRFQRKKFGMHDLEHLKQLDELSLSVDSATLQQLLQLPSRCLRAVLDLDLKVDLETRHLSTLCKKMSNLQHLSFSGNTHMDEMAFTNHHLGSIRRITLVNNKQLKSITFKEADETIPARPNSRIEHQTFVQLRHIYIQLCGSLQHLSGVGQLPSLETLRLNNCDKLINILSTDNVDREDENVFPKLQLIDLRHLPHLKSIYNGESLVFPSLQALSVVDCPQLRRLPFGLHSAKKMQMIKGTREWWDELQWDDDDIKSKFLHTFRPY